MRIRKAVITAAGRGVRVYPAASPVQKAMLPLVDRDGLAKPVLQIIAEEALESGIEEICVVCTPGDEEHYRSLFSELRDSMLAAYKGEEWARVQAERLTNLMARLTFTPQRDPLGYGHAVYCAREFAGKEPFLLLLGDHLYVSHVEGQRCAQQILKLAEKEECSVAGVQPTREHLAGRYGTVAGKRVSQHTGAYQIEKIIEKPSLSVAELELHTPGLRLGHYLCFFGMYVLTSTVFELLEVAVKSGAGEVQLTSALNDLAQRETYLALEVKGSRYDIGAKLGLLQAQIALGLAGSDAETLLSTIAEQLAEARLRRG